MPTILEWLVSIVAAGGGGAVVAFLVFRSYGSSWLESKFAERLEAFRHEKAKEIERLKADIDGALKSRMRFQEKQFSCTVEIWKLLREALAEIGVSVSPFQQYSDIRSMSQELKVEYMATFDILEIQRNEILTSTDPQREFQKMVDRKKFQKAAVAFDKFSSVLRSHEVFLDEEVF